MSHIINAQIITVVCRKFREHKIYAVFQKITLWLYEINAVFVNVKKKKESKMAEFQGNGSYEKKHVEKVSYPDYGEFFRKF